MTPVWQQEEGKEKVVWWKFTYVPIKVKKVGEKRRCVYASPIWFPRGKG